jgi:YegS/Rv2252/BmrU family lipid kinase
MSVAIIVNPLSGGVGPAEGRRRAERAAAVLTAADVAGDVFLTESRGHARDLAAAAVKRGARIVVAWGGDGTVNEVATSLVGTATALGVVPSGSGNGLARELGVARRPERALADALAATPRSIDAGELGGRLFVNVAGIGFDALVAACFDRDHGGRRGLATYARITWREMWRYEPRDYCVDGAVLRRALLVTLANTGQWGSGARIAPDARPDDGRLDLVAFEESSRLSAIATIPRLFLGTFSTARGVSTRRIELVAIECDRPMAFHVDGEPAQGGTRLEASVRPAALRVAVR